MPATYNLDWNDYKYSYKYIKVPENHGLTCEPPTDVSGIIGLYQDPFSKIYAYFDSLYFGFVSGNRYNFTSAYDEDGLIITNQIIVTFNSEYMGTGKFYYAKTDNLSSYCSIEGNVELKLYKEQKRGGGGGGAGCFISSLKYIIN